tara:strand:+ start:71 stop:352 length:282 start_codon:yes stop_codon:yes gene_type:complete
MTKYAKTIDRRKRLEDVVKIMNKRDQDDQNEIIFLMRNLLGITKCHCEDCSNYVVPRKNRKWCSGSCKTKEYRYRRDERIKAEAVKDYLESTE